MRIAPYFTMLLTFVLLSCASQVGRYHSDHLTCIQIVDRNELSETIGTKERLKKFQSTDFISSQPYQQVLRVFAKDSSGKTPALLTSYHANGQIWKYLEILDARAFGTYREWYENGQLKIEATVIGGPADVSPASQGEWLFDGLCFVWDEKGNILAEIPYAKGVLEGLAIHRHPNGEIAKIIPYEKNQIHGEFAEFTDQGAPLSKIQFQKDIKNGVSLQYWPNGTLSSLEVYKMGQLDEGTYYNSEGKKISEVSKGEGNQSIFAHGSLAKIIEIKQGRPEGIIQCFDTEGLLVSSYPIKNGLKEGTETLFFLPSELEEPNSGPVPKMTLEWKNDQIHGMVKTWYNNGTLQSQKIIYQNKKNGTCCSWYRNGKVMFIEEYENDLLIKGSYFKMNDTDPITKILDGNGTATLYDEKGGFIRKIHYEKGNPIESAN